MRSNHSALVTRLALGAGAAVWLLAGQPLAAQQDKTLVSCPFFGRGYSDVAVGFYVTGYRGTNLDTVTLAFTTATPGLFQLSLTAYRNSYDGPQIGTSQTATVEVPGPLTETQVTFHFGAAPVSPSDTVAFIVNGSEIASDNDEYGYLYVDAGLGNCAGVFETQGTSPPLDTVVQKSMGVIITESAAGNVISLPCVPSDTVLCVDDYPGDRRFQVTASFNTVQGNVHFGNGQAISLAALGTDHGGLFWFFNPGTPDMLVNVINGCALNDHYWVFLSSPTNVGYSVTVTDTGYLGSATYTHADLAAPSPVQDTMALADCNPCTSNAQCPTGLLCCFLPASPKACIQPAPGGGCPSYP